MDRARTTASAAVEPSWTSILSRAEASTEAVSALNVRVIVELAPLIQSPEKYESFRREALQLAASIRDEPLRTFALEQLKALLRSAESEGGRYGKLWRVSKGMPYSSSRLFFPQLMVSELDLAQATPAG